MVDNKENPSEEDQNGALTLELSTTGKEQFPVYVVGNFNDWKVPDELFRLHKTAEGHYQFRFPAETSLPDVLEYKYLHGGWEGVELDEYGNSIENRTARPSDRILKDHVPRWQQNGLAYQEAFLPQIRIISEAFEIPQLIKTRRVTALLPHNYSQTDKHYPVLYLQDGQNLFDDYAPFGNWAVDKKLAILSEAGMGDIIIVAIDHAEDERIAEFTPSIRTRLGRGDGKRYVRFLADTLKPYVDKHFRTLPERENTGIGGSSMGGLISIYAGLMYPEVYSKLMVFSPALWVAPNIHFDAINFDEASSMRIYLYGGAGESNNMIPNIQRFKESVEKQGISADIKFNISIDPQGKHNEARWGQEFPKALSWLFFHAPSHG